MGFYDDLAGFADHAAGSTDEAVGRAVDDAASGDVGGAGEDLTPEWVGTFDPTATLDPTREFGVDLLNSDNPDESVLEGPSQSFQDADEAAENTNNQIEDFWNQNTPDPGADLTPDWFDWITNNQEEVVAGVVILVALWLVRPYVGLADSATEVAT